MKRFMGMMPSSEIEKTGTFRDGLGLKIFIDAGPRGWTIRYADSSSQWKNNDATTEENYNDAEATLRSKISNVQQIAVRTFTLGETTGEVMGEC